MNSFASFWLNRFDSVKLDELDKRHLTLAEIEPILSSLPESVKRIEIGRSFENRPLHMLSIGSGPKNVLAWSCMHGNETTSLRGWLDWVASMANEEAADYFNDLLKEFTVHYIPMLNPDGAQRYARRNVMGIDMNRDARALVTPEMKSLMAQISLLEPVLAFNLHDQRNIFAVNNQPATLSFLAPSIDKERNLTPERMITMDLIGSAVKEIQAAVSCGIGRYTDEYYPTAIGEVVQQMGIPTVLVECGSSKDDELRQKARMLNPVILHAVLSRLSKLDVPEVDTYKAVNVNETNQVDILIRGVKIEVAGVIYNCDVALLEELFLKNGHLQSKYKVHDLGDLRHVTSLKEFAFASAEQSQKIEVGQDAHFFMKTDNGALHFEDGFKK